MINTAIISSTIYPPLKSLSDGSPRAIHTPEQRLTQTIETIESIKNAGIVNIFLVDNSGLEWAESFEERLTGVKILKYPQSYIYDNKGINELQMLLSCIDELPIEHNILKISGRYKLIKTPKVPIGCGWDVAGRLYHKRTTNSISTKMYLVRDREVFRAVLLQTLREVFAYQGRLVGPSSALRILRNLLGFHTHYNYEDPSLPIEQAFANIVFRHSYKFLRLEKLFIEGELGAFRGAESISE